MKQELEQLLLASLTHLSGSLLPEMPPASAVVVERTREAQHGDFASNVALRLAKEHNRPVFLFTYSGSAEREHAMALQRC